MNAVAGYSYIGWNQRRGGEPTRFADRRVRQAMTWLTDRARIIDEIMLGYAEPAVSPFSPRSRQHDPAIEPRPFDPDRATALLAEAGYVDRDGDGVLEDGAGEPFEFELVYYQENEDTERMVLFLKDLYARAGVHLKPMPAEWPVMLDLLGKRNYDAITLGWTSGVETDVYQMFHGSQTEDGGDNFVHFRHAEFDRLVDQARATVREEERMPLWQAVERIFHEEQPYTFLMRRKTLAFVDPAHPQPRGHQAGAQPRLRPGGDLHPKRAAALCRLRHGHRPLACPGLRHAWLASTDGFRPSRE